MAATQESLFSLELVVEKLYLPYVTCRFPAVAFKLLDFPTILISHVEHELAESIKRKIKIDPYYTVPNQFSELQDKHGNFMVKKGKSCLFKIAFQTLQLHLSNAPMYIMVIDEYPEVPKLLGNSSLALNETVDAIHKDIKVNGFTVPSVHGDKGLFKVYSLMGKEIGYVILGFRLLSLGPGLIAHLPATALVKRSSESKKPVEQKSVVEEIIEVKKQAVHQATHTASIKRASSKTHDAKLNSTREIGLNTDVEKCDALMQTMDIMPDLDQKLQKKSFQTMETQTEAQTRVKKIKRPVEELKFRRDENDESDDDLLLNPNIICPPPMFFNSNAEPKVHIEHDKKLSYDYESTVDDVTLEDLSGDEHIDTIKPKHDVKRKYLDIPPTRMLQDVPRIHDAKTVVLSSVKTDEKSPPNIDLQQLATSGPTFPLLTALLTELSKIQNPQFVSQAMNQVHQAASVQQSNVDKQPSDRFKTQPIKFLKSRMNENLSEVKEEEEKEVNSSKRKGRKSHKICAGPSDGVPKQKGWIRKAPEAGVKKTKLVFGLTNTQRLRLAKQNPTWLKTAEQNEKVAKAQRQKSSTRTKELDHDLDTGNLSDTYTEVRRLAAAELEKSTMGQTALSATVDESKVKKMRKKGAKSRDNSPAKSKHNRTRSKSPKGKSKEKQRERKNRKGGYSAEEEDKVMDLDADVQEIASPDLMKDDKLDSAADSMPSSRIEVHIPSARAYESEDEADKTFTESFEEVTPEHRRDTKSKFPGFNEDDTLPGSIAHEGTASMNSTTEYTDESPLESTRVSKQFHQGPATGESLFKSTEDYDTKQFQSTDEPELQKLISDHEQTDTLPTPVTERSARSPSPATMGGAGNNRLSMKFEVLNPKASQQSPLPAMRRSQQTLKLDSLNARPSPTSSRSSQSKGSPTPRNPTPRARKPLRERKLEFKKESIHTESVSSYMPSESENILSLLSDGSYSDDFHMSSDKDASSRLSTPELPKLIPSTKLGFTIS